MMKNPLYRRVQHFMLISRQWDLTSFEQRKLLGLSSEKQLNSYLSGKKKLTDELSEKIGCMIEIYTGLHTLLPVAHAANNWIRRPNSARIFRGRPALSALIDGEVELKIVRDYVVSETQGGYL